ncbi:unnamed protein product [Mytilus edulis]|uniref:PHD-type domain-containing protein n=1 Tax=Mytilus edulis TaxID=6550 RepID=A0A8S3T9E8_MYTED|nr:unnamed protein product [Mytilus edulis]
MIGIEHVQEQINMADIYNLFYAKYVSDLLNEEINSLKPRNIRLVKHPGQHTLLYLSLLLLTNSSDLELNPGPRAPKYPCQVCYKAVTWKDREVACDDCSKWYHAECMHMSTPVYNALASSNISWHCVTCDMPNLSSISFSLFESFMVNTSNSFEHLSDSNVTASPSPPVYTSSPIKTNKTDRNNYQKPKNTKIISCLAWGDINLPDICWKTQSITDHQNPIRINSTFLDLVQDNHLEQIVTFPTRKNHTLELFLTNRPSLVNRCEPLPGIGDHDIVYIDTDITAKINKPVKRKIFIWKKADAKEQVEKAMKLNTDFKEKFNLEQCGNLLKPAYLPYLNKQYHQKCHPQDSINPGSTRKLKNSQDRKREALKKQERPRKNLILTDTID